ncbi:MAG: hypothetical protein IKJ77_10045 [Firmicutes bacterium]|nr:hypothetical protein [Bacillota bacterium]
MKSRNMSTFMKSLLVLTLAFAFAFAPFVADQASAGTKIVDKTISVADKPISKISSTFIAQYSFSLDSAGVTYNLDAIAGIVGGTGMVDGTEVKLDVEKDGVAIAPMSPNHWEVSEPGHYTIDVYVPANPNLASSPIPKVSIEGSVVVESQSLPQYEFFVAEPVDVTDDSNIFTISAGAAKYQGNSDLGRLFYVKDHYTGQFMYMGELTSVATEANRVGVEGDRGKEYTVYVVNRNLADDNKNEVPLPIGGTGGTTSDVFTLTPEQEAKLAEYSQSITFSTPVPPVGQITKITYKKAITLAQLSWTVPNKATGRQPNITGYIVERYNEAGTKRLKSSKITKLQDKYGNYLNTVPYNGYTPYNGKSLYKVTPYFEYLGQTYYGTPVTKKVESKKLTATATDGNAVKITNNKAGYTVNAEYGATGVGIFQKKGSKWVLVKKSKINKERGWIYLTVSKTGIGKKNVKFKSYVVDGGKTYWSPITTKTKLIKPRKNQTTIGTASNIGAYPWLEVTKVRTKIWYEGNDMYVKYRVVNRDSKKRIAVQTTVVVENLYSGKFTTAGRSNKKYITLGYGKMGFVTVKIKNAKKVDLVNSIVR